MLPMLQFYIFFFKLQLKEDKGRKKLGGQKEGKIKGERKYLFLLCLEKKR